jgi:hypothetical protein
VLLGSTPRSSPGSNAWAETMPRWEPWTYGNWSSDVNVHVKSIPNRGRTGAAGVMSGACRVRQVIQMPQSGRVLQVGVPARGACPWQGSQGPFEC